MERVTSFNVEDADVNAEEAGVNAEDAGVNAEDVVVNAEGEGEDDECFGDIWTAAECEDLS